MLGPARNGRSDCPVCGKQRCVSLTVGENGKPLLHCFANNCKVWDFLKQRGAPLRVKPRADDDLTSAEKEDIRFRRAFRILRATKEADAGKPDKYLKARGLSIMPSSAMLLPANVAADVLGERFPAMVLPVVSCQGLLRGAQVTVLDRTGAARTKKLTFGLVKGNYAHLGRTYADRPLVVGEGVETTLSMMELTGYPGIATLGTAFMGQVNIPACSEVVIAADKGKAGQEAAQALADRIAGRRVVRIVTPRYGDDWNDALRLAHGDPDVLEKFKLRADEPHTIGELRDRIKKAKRIRSKPRLHALTREEFEALDIPPMEHFLAPILPVAAATVLHGQKGNGKTRIVLSIAEAIATGGTLLDWHSERKGKVLYIDGELPGRTIKLRLSRLKPTNGRLFVISRYQQLEAGYRMGKLTSEDLRKEIDRVVEAHGIDVIILDSFSSLVGENENDIDYWPAIEDWIMEHRGRGRTVLFILHEGVTPGRHRGLTKIIDQFDNKVRVEMIEDRNEADPDHFHFMIENKLIRDEGEVRYRPRQIARVPRDGVTDWEFVEIPEKAERGRPRNQDRNERMKELRDDGWAVPDIAKEMGVTTRAVYYTLNRMPGVKKRNKA